MGSIQGAMNVSAVSVQRGAPGRRVNGRGAARVHTRNGRAGRYAVRSARSSQAGEGRPACAVPGVRVQARRGCADARSPGVLSTGRGPACVGAPCAGEVGGGGAAGAYSPRLRRQAAAPAPAPAPAPAWTLAPAPGSWPAPCSAHAPAVNPAAPRSATLQCRPAPSERRGSGRGLGRPGRGRELRRSPGTLPGARCALPRAPARPLPL